MPPDPVIADSDRQVASPASFRCSLQSTKKIDWRTRLVKNTWKYVFTFACELRLIGVEGTPANALRNAAIS